MEGLSITGCVVLLHREKKSGRVLTTPPRRMDVIQVQAQLLQLAWGSSGALNADLTADSR